MKLRFLSIFAAAALLAACESPTEDAGNKGSGAAPVAKPSIAPGSEQDFIANVGDRVFFDLDKAALRADGKATLDKQVAWLKKYPNWKLAVEGHADERGTREYNLALGDKRAAAVKEYLVAGGIAKDRVKTISYGKERPVAMGANEAAWSQNRRGVTVLSK